MTNFLKVNQDKLVKYDMKYASKEQTKLNHCQVSGY